MRIASLVPSATEALFALGLGDSVVAVTHECDHPAAAARAAEADLERDRGRARAGRDRRPRARGHRPRRVVVPARRARPWRALAPDLIVTQALCAVCAVSYDDVCTVAAGLPSGPAVLSLDPETLDEVLDDLVRLAEAAGEPERGRRLLDELARPAGGGRRDRRRGAAARGSRRSSGSTRSTPAATGSRR